MRIDAYSMAQNTDRLKQLIAEYPDYPIVVLAGEDANNGDYGWMYCTDIRFDVGEILDTDYFDDNDHIFTDRSWLEEVIEERLYDNCDSEEELDNAVRAELARLEPYWKQVIFIMATN